MSTIKTDFPCFLILMYVIRWVYHYDFTCQSSDLLSACLFLEHASWKHVANFISLTDFFCHPRVFKSHLPIICRGALQKNRYSNILQYFFSWYVCGFPAPVAFCNLQTELLCLLWITFDFSVLSTMIEENGCCVNMRYWAGPSNNVHIMTSYNWNTKPGW